MRVEVMTAKLLVGVTQCLINGSDDEQDGQNPALQIKMQGNILRLERDIFQPTTQPTECGVLCDVEQLRRPLAVPAVL